MESPPDETTRLIDADKTPEDDLAIQLSGWEQYRVESLVGEGGMARVYKAYDPKLRRYVALKFIRSEDENLKKRFLREAQAQAHIEHDHVCKIYEVGTVQDKSYIAMQFIQGGTLRELSSEMTLDQKVLLMKQVSEAVQAAHRVGIIHRDIKPSNIMIDKREDGTFSPYVMDFGIAREISESELTATEVVMGTPAFMAPEQMMGDSHKLDRRTDIYSIGSTLYYAFTGQPPFEGYGVDVLVKLATEDPVHIKKRTSSIPEDLATIVSKCLEREPSRRYESARALAEDLKRYLEGEPILARPASWKQRVAKKIKKHKTVAAILVIASLLICGLAGFSIFSYWRTSKQVQIAREFSKSIEEMDWIMRVAHMAPLHNIAKERTLVLRRMQGIEAMMQDSGRAGVGPGNFALGRGFLTLQEYEKARHHLEKAWNAGYQGKEVASALGFTLGALYKSKLSEVDGISNQETRKVRLRAVESEYRDPAVLYLKQAAETASGSREYGEALLSYYEKNWNKALQLARASNEKFPWLYEARMLEADVFSRLGEEAFREGKFDLAEMEFQKAAGGYAQAGETARSDPAVYESQCALWRGVMEVQFATGKDAKKAYEESNAYCRRALSASTDSAKAFELLAQTAWRWGEEQFAAGEDPTAALNDSIEMSRKAQILSPNRAYAYYTMGTAYGYLADYELAKGQDPTERLNQSIRALQIAVEKDPSLETAFTNLGVAYFSQGAHAMAKGEDSKEFFLKAIAAYERALRISPRSLAPQANIANAYRNLATGAANMGADPTDYFQRSIHNYEKALKTNPNHWLIHINLSALYLDLIQYELDHGKDPTVSCQKVVAECQRAAELKPGNPYSAINASDAYVYFAEYTFSKKENPLSWTKKAAESLAGVTNLDLSEVYLALADARRVEAEYCLQKKESPLPALQKARTSLDRAFEINSAEHLIPLGQARLGYIRAKWLILNHQSPEESFRMIRTSLQKGLDLNPRSAQAYLMLGELIALESEWNLSRGNQNVSIREGLSAIEKSLQLNSDLAGAYAVRANLLLMEAPLKSDATERMRIADESVKSFERAFAINPMLQTKEGENYKKAKTIGTAAGV